MYTVHTCIIIDFHQIKHQNVRCFVFHLFSAHIHTFSYWLRSEDVLITNLAALCEKNCYCKHFPVLIILLSLPLCRKHVTNIVRFFKKYNLYQIYKVIIY